MVLANELILLVMLAWNQMRRPLNSHVQTVLGIDLALSLLMEAIMERKLVLIVIIEIVLLQVLISMLEKRETETALPSKTEQETALPSETEKGKILLLAITALIHILLLVELFKKNVLSVELITLFSFVVLLLVLDADDADGGDQCQYRKFGRLRRSASRSGRVD